MKTHVTRIPMIPLQLIDLFIGNQFEIPTQTFDTQNIHDLTEKMRLVMLKYSKFSKKHIHWVLVWPVMWTC